MAISNTLLDSTSLSLICSVFHTTPDAISDITLLKKGMTNKSIVFSIAGKKYILRIPGEGTDHLINRRNEAASYEAIRGKGLCQNPVYINPETGYMIQAFLENARVCDPNNQDDVKRCMKKLKSFHDMKLKVDHEFNIFNMIDFYESLWNGKPSEHSDYKSTKQNVLSLKNFLDKNTGEKFLTHIDAVPDNFLFVDDESGEKLWLTDWEYAGMADPLVDLAMFSVYSYYDKKQIDNLIDIYFDDYCCDDKIKAKIYCYVAMSGLLWSNWCEYKKSLGVDFGEYAIIQYNYARDFYEIAIEKINKLEKNNGNFNCKK